MISYGELFITLAAAAALFGPKDIPVIARAAGRYVGKAVGYMQSARGQLDEVMKRSQVDQVHKELHETMAQLEAIRYEIRNGMSISNPGPLTRSVLNAAIKPASPALQSDQAQADLKDTSTVQNHPDKLSDTQAVLELQELESAAVIFKTANLRSGDVGTLPVSVTSVKPIGFKPGPDGTFNTLPPSTARIAAPRVVIKPVGVRPSPPNQPSTKSDIQQAIVVLPISAVSAGLLPPRTDPLSGGADLVLESLIERKVAFDSQAFFRQSDESSKTPMHN